MSTDDKQLAELRKSIEATGVLPEFDQNLLFFLERKYFDFIDLQEFDLEKNGNEIDPNSDLRIVKVISVNHLEVSDIGLHLQNFSNLLAVLQAPHHTVFGIIKGMPDKTELYYGIAPNASNPQGANSIDTESYFEHNLTAALNSNYPGLSWVPLEAASREKEICSMICKYKKVNALPGIPTLRENKTKEWYYQGIDRFIEGMQGTEYMLMVIAEPIPLVIVNSMIKKLFDLSSDIHSFVKQAVMKTTSSSNTISVGANFSLLSMLTKTLSAGMSAGMSGVGVNAGISRSIAQGSNQGINANYSHTWQRSTAVSTESLNKSAEFAEQICNKYIERLQAGKNMGFWNAGVYLLSDNDYIQYKGTSLLSSVFSGDETYFEPFRSIPLSTCVSEKYLKHFTNPKYKKLLYGDEKYIQATLEKEMLFSKWFDKWLNIKGNKEKNIESCKQEFLDLSSDKQDKVLNEISAITNDQAIMKEINSEIQKTWENLKENPSAHPLGAIMGGVSTPLNTGELSIIMNMPRKEITGIPVLQRTEFGRNIRKFNPKEGKEIDIGELRYLGKGEKNRLCLNINSLCAHTFITGSTGSGKTNTVFNMLDKLRSEGITFLVIEPAKGEYKHVLGGLDGVHVLGTNPKHTEVLRINPFKFPEEIHVSEHLDRLIEIFNATWPMYAAMPALLKEAIEEVYIQKGWDLESSVCLRDVKEYPSMQDLVNIMPSVIKRTAYSAELKSNYIGALVSRLKSLTNGLYRFIFCEDEIDNHILFEENCIVDISRIGSMETKALIMGIVFMRMYEHRLSSKTEINVDLKHVTVLEEAHHLMRKTSFAQNEEYSNIQGKAVEMITNSIAEMRTFGEGFILVDQAPALLDLTAIRNTNTKIILRIPEQSDKEIVGFSANLNDNQIRELSRLETGASVVYQNDWVQAVTGRIDLYKEKKPFIYNYQEINEINRTNSNNIMKILLNPIVSEESKVDLANIDVEKLKDWLTGNPVNSRVKAIIVEILEQLETHEVYHSDNFAKLANLVAHLSRVDKLLLLENSTENSEAWNVRMFQMLNKIIDFPNKEFQVEFLHLILCDYAHQRNVEEINRFYFSWVAKNKISGVLC
ncbi:MAG: ATP-binding protein [Candidatus Cloacimonas sp.]|nr:ATP-binding protein [Candidatus Cloacimonas sp.]